jgi:hypothetical protein
MSPYFKTLGVYVQARTPPPENAAADIEHAYIALKSWLLLIHRLSPSRQAVDPRGELTKKIWNELWPSFESLVDLFQATGPRDEFSVSPLFVCWPCAETLILAFVDGGLVLCSQLVHLHPPVTITNCNEHNTTSQAPQPFERFGQEKLCT